MTDVTQQMLADGRFLVERLTDFENDGDVRTDDGERAWHGHIAPALHRFTKSLTAYEASRAALSAMPRDEGLEALLAKALRRLAFWAQTSGGTAGRDDGLVAAIDVGLAALRQYDTKLAQEPRS